MPPKFDPNDPNVAALVALFQSVGLSQSKAVESAKSPKNAASLKDIITSNNLVERQLDDKKLSLVSTLAVQGFKLDDERKSYVVEAIVDGRLKSSEQVNGTSLMHCPTLDTQVRCVAAVKYLEVNQLAGDAGAFNLECGVGRLFS